MGAKLTVIQGVIPCWIKENTLFVRDPLKVVHKGHIKIGMDFEEDNIDFMNPVFVNLLREDKHLVLRHDYTFSLLRVGTKELLDLGSFEMEDPSLFNVEYTEIGYLRFGGLIETLVLDLRNKLLVHSIRGDLRIATRTFRCRYPFVYDIDLSRATLEAHRDVKPSEYELYIYTEGGRVDWREELIEISSTI